MNLDSLPTLGVGLGWRKEIQEQTLANLKHIDWLEIISEHYINHPEDRLRQAEYLSKLLPVIPHGIDLSIGTDVPIEDGYFEQLAEVVRRVNAPWFTDHLCFTRVPGVNVGQLTPLQFTRAAADIVIGKVRQVRERIDRPFLLENITYQFVIPGGKMAEAEFLTTVLEESDIGLLLDVTNLFINSSNHGYDPYRFLHSIPLERVVQLHIAGGTHLDDRWYDTHSMPVQEEVHALVEYVLAHAPVKAVLLERDANFPADFQELVDELCRVREVFNKYQTAAAA